MIKCTSSFKFYRFLYNLNWIHPKFFYLINFLKFFYWMPLKNSHTSIVIEYLKRRMWWRWLRFDLKAHRNRQSSDVPPLSWLLFAPLPEVPGARPVEIFVAQQALEKLGPPPYSQLYSRVLAIQLVSLSSVSSVSKFEFSAAYFVHYFIIAFWFWGVCLWLSIYSYVQIL